MSGHATVVADAGPGAGLGHVSRSTALAVALRCQGMAVRALAYGSEEELVVDGVAWGPVREGDEPAADGGEVVVLDSYRLPPAAARALAARGPLVAFHDAGQSPPPAEAAVVITLAGERPDWLSGPRYACLRPGFWGLEPAAPAGGAVRRVLVATGGGLTADGVEFAAALAATLPGVEVRLVVGPYAQAAGVASDSTAITGGRLQEDVPAPVVPVRAPDGLRDELLAADLVVTTAGQTMLEALCVGTPCVATALADNQRGQLGLLAEVGAVVAAERDEVAWRARALAADSAARVRLATAARAAVDGFGALRVAARVAGL